MINSLPDLASGCEVTLPPNGGGVLIKIRFFTKHPNTLLKRKWPASMQLSAAFFFPQQKSFTFRDRLSSWCTAVWLRIWYDFDELKMVFIIFWDWSKMFGSVKSLWEYILFTFQEIHSHLLISLAVHPDYFYNQDWLTAKVACVKDTVQLVILSQ